MQLFNFKRATLFAAALLLCGSASASLIGATVSGGATLTNGVSCINTASIVNRPVDGAVELNNGAWDPQCAGLYTANIGADGIELTATEPGEFGVTKLHFDFSGGAAITNVTFAGEEFFFEFAPNNFLPIINFTKDSIDIEWNAGSDFFRLGEGFAFFDVVTEAVADSEVPEPASIALFGLALAGLAGARRKSKRA